MRNMAFSSNQNMDYSQSSKKAFGSRKIFLLIMAILAAASDLALLIVFAIAGHDGIAIPIILIIVDGLFITGVALSNFRFKYSIGIWGSYIIVSVLVTAFLSVLETGDKYMTDTAKILNIISHAALYVVTLLASIYPIFKDSLKLKAFMVVAVAIAAVSAGVFAAYFSANGYFGQGYLDEYRVVGYTLDPKSDTYTATSIKKGRSNKVVIPEEFNGKKVSGINCAILTDASIRTIEIQSKDKIEFAGIHILGGINMDLKIGVDKNHIDEYREEFLGENYRYLTEFVTLSNNFYPINLEEDERYITFAYLNSPYQEEIIPTWIGKKGQEFNFDYAKLDYLDHSNAKDDADLVWCYDNNNRKILSGEILDIVGKRIDANKNSVAIDFENVYKIKIDIDNDDKYESPDSLKKTVVGDKVYDYRFVTLGSADEMLDNWIVRDGFNIGWRYNESNGVSSPIVKLSDKLSNYNLSVITIYPEWVMIPPAHLKLNFNKSSYVYGDNVVITASSDEIGKDFKMKYKWEYSLDSSHDITEESGVFTLNNVRPQYSNINLKVTLSCDSSSLTATALISENLQVEKRALHFTWQEPSNMVYDGHDKYLTYSLEQDDLINGDTLDGNITVNDETCHNAGTFTAAIFLEDGLSDNYYIAKGARYTYTVAPCPLQVEWTSGDFTYDGNYHNATATAVDLFGDYLALSISNAQRNAGRHTATATVINTNYEITNPSYEFEIKQKSVTVIWNVTPLVYSGRAQHPNVARINGLIGSDNIDSQLIYADYLQNIDAGSGYTVKVQLPSSCNYKFDSEQYISYNIGKKALQIRTVANDKIYDKNVNTFDFSVVSGLADIHSKNSLGIAAYVGDGARAVDAGRYTVTAELPVNDVTKNYDITYQSATFNINKAQESLNWSKTTYANGKVIPPEVITAGQEYSDDIKIKYIYRDSNNVEIQSIPYISGRYTVEAQVESKNYIFTNTLTFFSVVVNETDSKEAA